MLKKQIKIYKSSNITVDLVGFFLYKTIYQKLFLKKNKKRKILFIVGCQRSGTSLMTRIFFRDIRVKVYRESSILSSRDPIKLRLNPLPLVKEKIDNVKAPLIVLKPLVESQNIIKLMDFFPESRAIWMLRHYKDVASSNLKFFGEINGIDDLKPIIENNPNDWRSEGVTPYTRSIVIKFFKKGIRPIDAAALFWFVRNQIFYDLKLGENPRISVIRYENLVKNPKLAINHIYNAVGMEPPKNESTNEVHSKSVKKGWNVSLSEEVEEICSNLLSRLEQSHL